MRNAAILLALALASCGESHEDDAPPPATTAPAPVAPARCGAAETYEGGEILETDDGARLFYRVAGPAGAPAVVYLHGGPGYNAWGFQQSVGPALERSLRMVYLDQRGCGRSSGGPASLALGMDPTVQDLERLREHLGIARWSVIGHSFGGLVALVYATRHPDAVERVVLVEATGDPEAALAHQVQVLAEGGSPTIVAVAQDQRPALDRMMYLYQMLGRAEVSRRLHWANLDNERRAEALDQRSLLSDCSRDGVLPAYREGGWIAPHAELMHPLPRPSIYIAGRRSHVMPPERIVADAASWGASVVWMDESGHFPFAEEPERFVETVVGFLAGPDTHSAAP